MKKIFINIGLTGLLITGLGACNKLQYTPQQSMTAETVYKDINGIKAAVIGSYSLLQGGLGIDDGDYAFDIISMPESFSDNAVFSGTFPTRQEYSVFRITTANLTNQGMYDMLYYAAVRTNDVIESIQAIKDMDGFTDEMKDDYLSQLYTIRAYAYFYLTCYYGNVPLVLKSTTSETVDENASLPNTAQSEIMAQIEKDLLWSESHIGSASSGAYVSKATIEAFLARFYLYNGNYEKAKTYSEKVINNSGASLDPSYDDIFSNVKGSPGVLWYINYNASDGNSIAFYFFNSSMGGRQEVAVRDPNMFGDSTSTDVRKATTIINGNVVFKYRDAGTGADPVILFRLGEQYLIAAETEARAGNYTEADTYLNAIRERAGLTDTTLDANNYLDIILEERRKELAFEMGGFRLLDLRRTGRAAAVLGPLGYTSPKCDLWPFPQADMDANPNLKQNTGY